MKILIHNVCREGTHVLGPGLRYVIWVQGCNKRCSGCVSPESRALDVGVELDHSDLAADIVLNKYIDGVTISGGEPFLQATQLSAMLKEVKRHRPELTVIVYSGYQIEELRQMDKAHVLLAEADVLIDGPYEEKLNDNKGIRGSNNQRIISLTHRLDDYLETMQNGKRHIQHVAYDDKSAWTIGVPPM